MDFSEGVETLIILDFNLVFPTCRTQVGGQLGLTWCSTENLVGRLNIQYKSNFGMWRRNLGPNCRFAELSLDFFLFGRILCIKMSRSVRLQTSLRKSKIRKILRQLLNCIFSDLKSDLRCLLLYMLKSDVHHPHSLMILVVFYFTSCFVKKENWQTLTF